MPATGVITTTTSNPLAPGSLRKMASFSSLEQNKSMAQDMAQTHATSLLGQTVVIQDDASVDRVLTGIVDPVEIQDGKSRLMMDGRGYLLSDVISVQTTPVSALPLMVSPKPMTQPKVIETVAASP